MVDEQPEDGVPEPEPYTDRGRWVLRIIVGVAIVALGAFLLLRPAEDEAENKTSTLPAFKLPRLAAAGDLSNEDLVGHPVVINFWASWCTPCRQEAPLLERTWKKYEDQGLIVLGVDVQDTPDNAENFVREFDLTYPLIVDEDRSLFREVAAAQGLPQTFFVDEEGNFLESGDSDEGSLILGAIDEEELEAKIQSLLGGR